MARFVIHILGETNVATVSALKEDKNDSAIHCGNVIN
jgi:hypothetical protein